MVLHGLGGMGKSELALQYAHEHQKEYSSIWWISVPTISQGFLGIAQELAQHHAQYMVRKNQLDYGRIAAALGLPPNTMTRTGRIQASEEAVMSIISTVKEWLAAEHNRRWLIILDNHDDPEVDVMKYLPSNLTGSIIITSRVPDSAHLGDSLEVVGADEEDAIEILRKSARMDLTLFGTRKLIHSVIRLVAQPHLYFCRTGNGHDHLQKAGISSTRP
jgi:hypothetical protein